MPLETKTWVGAQLAAGRYTVLSELGAGGMAFVYLALDREDNRKVVVKVPRPAILEDADFAGRFVREGKSLVRLVHPHIVKIFDAGEHAGRPFLVMEFLPGGDLRERLKRGNQSVNDLQTWLPAIASALDFCHANDCVHRDVKPDNILFDAQGKAYLSDFGIAKVMSKSPKTKMTVLTSAGMVLGTPQYMAPELVMGQKYDGKADQYGLAATVYECLAGQTPFDGKTPMAVIVAQSTKEVPSLKALNPAVPKKVAEFVHRSLAKDPSGRFADCMSLAQAVVAAKAEPREADLFPTPEPDALKVTCPACQKRFNVPVTAVGKKLRCPACKAPIPTVVEPVVLHTANEAGQNDDATSKAKNSNRVSNRGSGKLFKRMRPWAWRLLPFFALAGGIEAVTYFAINDRPKHEPGSEALTTPSWKVTKLNYSLNRNGDWKILSPDLQEGSVWTFYADGDMEDGHVLSSGYYFRKSQFAGTTPVRYKWRIDGKSLILIEPHSEDHHFIIKECSQQNLTLGKANGEIAVQLLAMPRASKPKYRYESYGCLMTICFSFVLAQSLSERFSRFPIFGLMSWFLPAVIVLIAWNVGMIAEKNAKANHESGFASLSYLYPISCAALSFAVYTIPCAVVAIVRQERYYRWCFVPLILVGVAIGLWLAWLLGFVK